MRCPGFSAELYDLYAIGTLEAEEASEVAAHVAQSCETCSRELKKSLHFWSLFGSTFSPDAGEPGRRLLMSENRPSLITLEPGRSRPLPSWNRWVAVAATLAIVSALATWSIVVRNNQTPQSSTVRLVAENKILEKQVSDLARARDEAIQQRDQARTGAAKTSSQIASLERSAGERQTELGGVQQMLATMRGRFEQSESALQEARAREVKLEAQLSSEQNRLTEALRNEQTAQTQLQQVSAQVRQAEAQVQTLTLQVRELTKQRTDLMEAMQVQQRQSSQSLRMIATLSLPGTRLVQIPGTEAAPGARAYALLAADRSVVFYGTGLPALPAGRDYQLWLVRSKSPAVVSAGVFHPVASAGSQLEFSNANLTSNITAIAVTDEPAGGSRGPTGHKVLVGVVKPS